MRLEFKEMPVDDFCRLMTGIAGDARYERAVRVLPAIVTHFVTADPNAPPVALRLRAQRAAEFRDWIEHGVPMVTA
jgi:hypothetical protein